MPRVHYVKKARKDNEVVKKGESYYWWKPYGSPKRFSKTQPSRSMLTGSAFLSQIYTLEDETLPTIMHPDDIGPVIQELEDLQLEVESSRDNMPDHLQDVGTGEMLQERYNSVQEFIDALQQVQDDYDQIDDYPEDERSNKMEEFLSELGQCSYEGE